MTTLSDHREAVLRRAYYTCELRRIVPGHSCSGHLQAMHVLPKQGIRLEQGKARVRGVGRHGSVTAAEERLIETSLDELLRDGDNGLAGCSGGHRDHDLWRSNRQGRLLRVPRAALPDRIFTFAEHYALEALLDREYPPTNQEAP